MKKTRKKPKKMNKLIVIFCLIIIAIIVTVLIYAVVFSKTDTTIPETPIENISKNTEQPQPTKDDVKIPIEKPPLGSAEENSTKVPVGTTDRARHEYEPLFVLGYDTFNLDKELYNLISKEDLFSYMEQSFGKLKEVSNVLVTETLTQENGIEDARTKVETVRTLFIDYNRYFIKQTVKEKQNNEKPVLTEEAYHTKEGVYSFSELDEAGGKVINYVPHARKISRYSLLESASLKELERSPFHLVDSLTSDATLPLGFTFGENEKEIVLVKQSEEAYFNATNIRYEVYWFSKTTWLPIRFFEFQSQSGNLEDYTMTNTIYNNWNKLKPIEVPEEFALPFSKE